MTQVEVIPTSSSRVHASNGAKLQSTYLEISNSFFLKNRANLAQGVVETPADVVTYLIDNAYKHYLKKGKREKDVSTIRWLDPACGTGAFAIGILELYLESTSSPTYGMLPKLTIIDVDPEAVETTLHGLDERLNDFGLTVGSYVESGRLNFVIGDFLEISSEQVSADSIFSEKYDIVVGNPPYVRARNLPERNRVKLKQLFPSVYLGNSDLYMYFYAGALHLLDLDGIVGFITPANFFRSQNAMKLRAMLSRESNLIHFIDFGERPIFEGVSIHSGIFIFQKGERGPRTIFVDLSLRRGPFSIQEVADSSKQEMSLESNVTGGWVLVPLSRNRESFRRQTGKTLSTTGFTIYSGIRTGYLNAYLLDMTQVNRFRDPDSWKIIEKILLPSDIEVRIQAGHSRYIINLPNGCEEPSPEILEYLESFRTLLMKRSDSKNLKSWYHQRSCAYLPKMKQQKIVFPDITVKPKFGLAAEELLVSDGAYFIDSADLALIAILNSRFAFEYFVKNCGTIGSLNSGGRFRMKKNIVAEFPLPEVWGSDDDRLHELRNLMIEPSFQGEVSSERINHCDELVSSLYEKN